MENFREKRLERQLRTQRTISIVIAVLFLLAVAGVAFLFVRNQNLTAEKEELFREKGGLLSDLRTAEEVNAQLQADIQRLNGQLDIAGEYAASLEAGIETRDIRISRLIRQVAGMEQLRARVAELELLEEEFPRIEMEKQELHTQIQSLDAGISSLQNRNQGLISLTEEAAYLKAYNICVHNHRDRWLGRPVTMERAARVNRTTVTFEINGNIFIEKGSKNIHLLMTDPGGNVIEPSEETFMIRESGITSNFTEFTNIQYNQRSVPLGFTINHDKKLDPGAFIMEVYIDGVKAGAKEFLLE